MYPQHVALPTCRSQNGVFCNTNGRPWPIYASLNAYPIVHLAVKRHACYFNVASGLLDLVAIAAFQSPCANGAHDFEVGKIPVQPYVAFHSRTEPRWLIVLSCSVYYSYY